MSSFATEISTVINNDTSLNKYADGGISYENLIDNWLAESKDDVWIVYSHNKSNQTNCLASKNVYMNYTLNIVVIQRNTNDQIDIITNRLVNYLNDYSSGNIVDIWFVNDSMSFNQQMGVYTNNLTFDCTYIESE